MGCDDDVDWECRGGNERVGVGAVELVGDVWRECGVGGLDVC